MPKALTRLSLALAAVALCAASARAQTTLEWIVLAPEGERFAAMVPKEALRLEQEVQAEELAASGQRYAATAAGGARYVVWSLNDSGNVAERLKGASFSGWSGHGESRHLDLVAEAAWVLLVKPEFERLELERLRTGTGKEFIPSMSYVRGFTIDGRAAREYSVRLESEGGTVYVCADGARLYVAAALASDPQAADSRRFVESFAVGTKTPRRPQPQADPQNVPPGTGTGTGTGGGSASPGNVGRGDPPQGDAGGGVPPVNQDRPFRHSEVTKKSVITFKPEPGFTEGARKFEVTGVVRLRAVLSKAGEVTNISVVKSLPHGLTEKSIEAARRIRYTPAQKDGRPVAQYVVLEYNYNIY